MADYFVSSAGSHTSPYDTWANASTSLATALAAASTNGDRVILQHNAVPTVDSVLTSDAIYSFAASVALIAASADDAGTAWTPVVMGTNSWIGGGATNYGIILTSAAAVSVYAYGITLRINAGTGTDQIQLGTTDGFQFEAEECYFWDENQGNGSRLKIGDADDTAFVRLKNSTVRFGSTGQQIDVSGRFMWEGGTLSSAGSAPSTLISFAITDSAGSDARITGVDLSHMGSGTLVADSASMAVGDATFSNCKMGTGFVALATQTKLNLVGSSVMLFNCSDADTHYAFAAYDTFGETVVSTGIYANDGAEYDLTGNKYSWKITTSAYCSYYTPYISPWIHQHHEGTSAITPYLEILRDGSTTAYQDNQVWGEWSYQGFTGTTQGKFVNDRKTLTGTPANQAAGVGLAGWTGEAGSAWSGKLAPGATITPAEIGNLSGRVCVGAPSITVYVDPQIRT